MARLQLGARDSCARGWKRPLGTQDLMLRTRTLVWRDLISRLHLTEPQTHKRASGTDDSHTRAGSASDRGSLHHDVTSPSLSAFSIRCNNVYATDKGAGEIRQRLQTSVASWCSFLDVTVEQRGRAQEEAMMEKGTKEVKKKEKQEERWQGNV
eukprot:2945062-Rhodomonas_salina.1